MMNNIASKAEQLLSSQNLQIGYYNKYNRQQKVLLNLPELGLQSGKLVALLGANGSGKSTLLRSLAGLQKPLSGAIFYQEQPLEQLSASQLARQLALVLTERLQVSNLSVEALLALGRSPHTNWLGKLKADDRRHIQQAMQISQINHLAKRNLQDLSDGERQKVMIARALAQDTPLILLDEPTTHLDLPNRMMIFRLLQKLAHQENKGILLSTHDLDLALQTADELWLIAAEEGKIYRGCPEDLILKGYFSRIFAHKALEFSLNSGRFILNRSLRNLAIEITGEEIPKFWLHQALIRSGIEPVALNATHELQIKAQSRGQQVLFELNDHTQKWQSHSVAEVLEYIKQVYPDKPR